MTSPSASATPYSDALGLTTPQSFAALIRGARLGLSLTVDQAAEKIGVSRDALIHWERPGGSLPRVQRVPAIADALGLELHELATLLDAAAVERR